ncbi:alkaline phosphatase D family protein [Hyphococcus flavus]|uniref:Alkaline phosphatase D family protein n=1 Tax=Hyphococcus flavus TaxID=1866326 RepID=A0AAF0CCA3_9PROT|nr:alkaline phosphatase D family protein [Hyphococcus flavus]WDI32995.1 alkaline phosphatase D family protein [Hyphococcus flavus]
MVKMNLLMLGAASIGLAACASTHQQQVDGGNDSFKGDRYLSIAPEEPQGWIQAVPMPSAPLDQSKTLTRIVFASCAQQNEDQSIWDQIASENPDLTLYIGDNVYGDVRSNDLSLPELKAAYMRLAQSEPFSRVRAAAPMLTTWDDHDYGMNDAGGEYEYKESAEALFEYVWAVPDDDPRRSRPGIYGSWIVGEDSKRVQIIMLDTRFFRSKLKPTDERGAPGKERYIPDSDPAKTMLGEEQWAWLAEELQKPADLRLLVSSVQVIADGHGWEAWKMLPAERARLYKLIAETDANGVIMLTGDRHSAALYRKEGVNDYPLFEATSSSLNLPLRAWLDPNEPYEQEPGPNRLGDMIIDANYGLVEIDWAAGDVEVTIRGENGETLQGEVVALESLR